MIYVLLTSIGFWAALIGLVGTLLIFFFGLPPRIHPEGHINLVLEQVNEGEKKKAKKYKVCSYIGISLLSFSFVLQLISVILLSYSGQ